MTFTVLLAKALPLFVNLTLNLDPSLYCMDNFEDVSLVVGFLTYNFPDSEEPE